MANASDEFADFWSRHAKDFPGIGYSTAQTIFHCGVVAGGDMAKRARVAEIEAHYGHGVDAAMERAKELRAKA